MQPGPLSMRYKVVPRIKSFATKRKTCGRRASWRPAFTGRTDRLLQERSLLRHWIILNSGFISAIRPAYLAGLRLPTRQTFKSLAKHVVRQARLTLIIWHIAPWTTAFISRYKTFIPFTGCRKMAPMFNYIQVQARDPLTG